MPEPDEVDTRKPLSDSPFWHVIIKIHKDRINSFLVGFSSGVVFCTVAVLLADFLKGRGG